jgi:magnesium-transporting ATPase (P-type)
MGVAMGKEGTDVAREASEMILADDNFATIVVAVKEGRVVWDNLRKILLVNTPINNAQGLSVLFGIIFGLPDTPLTAIQVLYSNLICAVTLGFVCAIEPAEDGIMDQPPRKVGKRLIGRYLFLRIIMATIVLTGCVVGSVFIAQALMPQPVDQLTQPSAEYDYALGILRSQAINTLDFGAISVTLSARFTYNSSFHPRLLKGNKFAWYSVAIVAVLQVAITYIPGLNKVVFKMTPMGGEHWGITIAMMFIVFIVMELEKALRRALKAKGADTDDRERFLWDKSQHIDQNIELPKGASHLNLTELNH